MKSNPMRGNRRCFLKQAGLVGGTGALVALIPRPVLPTEKEVVAIPARKGRGYRLTAHIRSYYKKAGL